MSKFINYNSAECQVLKEVFEKMPMMDTYVANIVEEYIYSTVREYFPETNIIRCEYTTRYGELHGEYKCFRDDGNIWTITNFKDGKLDGKFTQYTKKGDKQIECHYINGKLNGLYTEYNAGMKSVECTYKDDKKNGLETAWYSGGVNKRYELDYKEGIMDGLYKRWNQDGSLQYSNFIYKF